VRTALLLNPSAGTGTTATQNDLGERLAAALGVPVEAYPTETGEAMLAAAEAVGRAGFERVLVAGGDGSVNLCINGLARAGALARTVVGIIPAGTGNDLATFLGMPTDLDAAIAALAEARPTPLDLGEMNGLYFANASCGGYFGEVSEATSSELKSVARRLAYVLAGATVFLQHTPTSTRLTADTEFGPLEWAGPLSMFAVCNGMTVGGGRPLAPEASVSDGLFDVFFVKEVSGTGLASVLLQMGRGLHLDHERVIGFRARHLTLHFDEPTLVNVDGEVSPVDSAIYTVHPRATRILVPPAFLAQSVTPESPCPTRDPG
jgi:diacylglycerol kinase (ATP)